METLSQKQTKKHRLYCFVTLVFITIAVVAFLLEKVIHRLYCFLTNLLILFLCVQRPGEGIVSPRTEVTEWNHHVDVGNSIR